jgi:hypothetical protein
MGMNGREPDSAPAAEYRRLFAKKLMPARYWKLWTGVRIDPREGRSSQLRDMSLMGHSREAHIDASPLSRGFHQLRGPMISSLKMPALESNEVVPAAFQIAIATFDVSDLS